MTDPYDERPTLLDILGRFAQRQPVYCDNAGSGSIYCVVCEAEKPYPDSEEPMTLADHREFCPWRRAVEFIGRAAPESATAEARHSAADAALAEMRRVRAAGELTAEGEVIVDRMERLAANRPRPEEP